MSTVRKDPKTSSAGKQGRRQESRHDIGGPDLPGEPTQDIAGPTVSHGAPGSGVRVFYPEPGQGAGGVPLPDSVGNASPARKPVRREYTGSHFSPAAVSEYDVRLIDRSRAPVLSTDTPATGGRSLKLNVSVPVPVQAERLGVDVGQAVNQWAQMLPLFIENSVRGQEAALQRAAQAYQPQPQLRPVDLELLEMQKNAAESILSGTHWLTAAEVAEESGRSRSNPYALANRWKKEGRVFAIKYQGVERYPRYAFDEHMEPRPVIAEVIRRFAADAGDGEIDPWEIAAWFESSNTYLDSARPRERLDAPDVIAFAMEHMNNWMHG